MPSVQRLAVLLAQKMCDCDVSCNHGVHIHEIGSACAVNCVGQRVSALLEVIHVYGNDSACFAFFVVEYGAVTVVSLPELVQDALS